jgi:DNA-binding transcriptional ArsR family regulator
VPRPRSETSVFAALADGTRRAILLALVDGERTAGELGAPLGASQSALSQHLAMLRRTELVTTRREGRNQIYALRPQALLEVATWMQHFDRFWDDRLARLGRHLAKPKKSVKPS